MKSGFLYIVVFFSGGAVLSLEILGTRILGPFYGVSLFLWSALIAVTLIALSVGYAVGGRYADKDPKMSRLLYIIAGAGLWTVFIPVIKTPVLLIAEPFGLRFAVLTAAFILFVPPLTLLGMVSPYAIKVRTSSLKVVGRTAGDLYAISTVGSVVFALLTGFYLVPNIGVTKLTWAIGLTLLLLVAAGMIIAGGKVKTWGALAVLFFMSGMAWFFIPTTQAGPDSGLVVIQQSPYAELRVVDHDGKRHMVIDGGVHTIVETETWRSFFPYTAVVDLTRDFFDMPGEILLIGLGGGSVVKNFAREGWDVQAVEIDPVVVELAETHFGLLPTEGQVFTMDGRQFLMQREQKYDVIVMDAFGSSSIPFHLVTREAFGLINSRLKPNGVLAINLEARGWHDVLVRSLTATLRNHFEHVLALPTGQPEERLGNVVLYASHRELVLRYELEWNFADPGFRHSKQYYQNRAWQDRFEPDTRAAMVLTDDLNPVDLWSEAINLQARKVLHDYFEEEGVSW